MSQNPLLAERAGTSERPESEVLEGERGLDRLIIRDLVVTASIGVHAHEHLAPQRVCINVDLRVRNRSGDAGDDISQVVSYEDIVEGIKAMIAQGHINLVESLAERIAALCLRNELAVSVTVRVEKPDVLPDAAAVGFEIVRRRPAAPPAEVLELPTDETKPPRAS